MTERADPGVSDPPVVTGASAVTEAPAVPAERTRAALVLKSETEFVADEMQAARAGTWDFLGRVLAREPDSPLIDTLVGLDEIDTGAGPIALGWELMRRAAVEADVDALAAEYFDLFVGMGRGELVPFGSWYQTGFLMEKPVARLRQDLDALGIERAAGVAESEDHIAALADAMAILIRSAGEIPLARQRAFFDDHLAPWATRFFEDLQNASSAHFYRSVGFFGASVIAFERELLAMQD